MNIDAWSALVTGGGNGLGHASAQEARRRGAEVVVADLDTESARAGAAAAGAVHVPTDVSDSAQVAVAVEHAVSLAPLRLVVTCAGIGMVGRVLGGKSGPMTLASWQRTLDVNLTGTFNALRLGAARMVDNEPVDGDRGVIVMTASVAAFDGQIGQVAYSATKAAIAGMTLPVARDLAERGIRVVTIAPGMFDTSLLGGLPQPARESLAQQVPHPSRLGRPVEFAQLVGHVLDNHMLNGEVIRLDGALRMAPR